MFDHYMFVDFDQPAREIDGLFLLVVLFVIGAIYLGGVDTRSKNNQKKVILTACSFGIVMVCLRVLRW